MFGGLERGTTESMPESIPVLRDRFRYYRIDYGMTESVHGRKIRAPKISFGVTNKSNDNLVMSTKHEKGFVK